MKRLATGIGLVLLIACFSAAPAGAVCYECFRGGEVCNAEGWCTTIYTCGEVSGFCAACWADCYEDHFGGFCHWTSACQWVRMLPSQPSPAPACSNGFSLAPALTCAEAS